MKKTIKKNWLKALIISVSLLLINCSVEEEVISGSHFGPQNKKFTYLDFLKETKAKDFDIFSKYNVSRSINGVMQKSIQQDFITDTTEIKRLEIPNTDKTTYSFKIYPLTEQLNSKEYYNMVVEKNGNQLTYMVFFNKDKLNPTPSESKTESSLMVYNSRNTHNGFVEVVTVDRNCRGSKCTGACDLCDECTTTTVSYVYVGNQTQIIAPNGNNTTGGTGTYNGGYIDGPFNGLYIPNPYDGLDDPNNPLFQMAGNINIFLNSLPQELKSIAISPGMFSYSHVYFQQNGLNNITQEKYTNALINFKNLINNFNPNDITFESFSKFKFWAFNVFLENNIQNNIKVSNIKNFINNQNIAGGTKEKIIDELATKNNQEILDFISETAQLSQNEPNQQDVDELVNMSLILEKYKENFENDNFILEIDQFMDLDISNYMVNNPGSPFFYFTIQCAVLRANHPNWSDAKIYWEASKEMIHIALDVIGLVPVVGEVADLTNGVLYVIEGDGVNATLSFASAVPVVGWVSTGTKYAIKVTNTVQTASVISTRVVLTWKRVGNLIDFGYSGQLRKVLGLANGVPFQAHHIIPWAFRNNEVVQRASRSGSAFHMNEELNGVALSTAIHMGSHPTYSNRILQRLTDFNNNFPNATPQQCYDEITDIINDVRTAIQNNPNTHINQLNF